jgi:hypothetical protein
MPNRKLSINSITRIPFALQTMKQPYFMNSCENYQNPSQKCLLAQYHCWCLALNPRHTTVCLRFTTHKDFKIRREVQQRWKTRLRCDLEPKSYF